MSLKVPKNVHPYDEAHRKWTAILEDAQNTVEEDAKMQEAARQGQSIPGRALPAETVGRFYSSYCNLINQMYDAYLSSVHLQRSPYILAIVNVFVKRMYELRNELIHLIVNDYFYTDAALAQMKLTPFDIQIVVPYHFGLETRPESAEEALQKMWADAVRRKRADRSNARLEECDENDEPDASQSENMLDDIKKIHEESQESAHTIVGEEYGLAVRIQKQERFRQWYMRDFREKSRRRKMYLAGKVEEPPLELKHRAARLIQRVYREVMKIKRQRIQEEKRDILLGMISEHSYRNLGYKEETEKFYERRRQKRLKITQSYLRDVQRENARLLFCKWDGQVEDITEQIREWFKEWYHEYGYFPQYPYEVEGGTILLVTGQYPTPQEQKEADEKEAEQNKGKTPEQRKQEAASLREEAKRKAEEEKIKAKKEAFQAFKAKCNPADDPGYKMQSSSVMSEIEQALNDYRNSWSLYDNLPKDSNADAIYGYMKPVLIEDLMEKMHKDCRKYVDELMRLDLKLLIAAQKQMYKTIGKEYPKAKPRKKPKIDFSPRLVTLNSELRKTIEPLFDHGLVTKPDARFSDIFGDISFGNCEYSIQDPHARFLPPAYGDVKNRLMLSCVLGCGIQPGADRNKAVMLLGPPRNGKSFLIDAVAGELNAVKIDISPEVFSAVIKAPSKLLPFVFVAARAFQPAVIYMRNIERVFCKKVPPEEAYLKATELRTVLPLFVKQIREKDNVIFLATCSNPVVANGKPMTAMFDEIILVPKVDFGSLSMFFRDHLKKEPSVPSNFPILPLAQIFRGYGFGVIIEAYHEVMTPERRVSMNIKPLRPAEFVEAVINKGEPLTDEEYLVYEDFYMTYSPLKAEKMDYAIINEQRAEYYSKMHKKDKTTKSPKNVKIV